MSSMLCHCHDMLAVVALNKSIVPAHGAGGEKTTFSVEPFRKIYLDKLLLKKTNRSIKIGTSNDWCILSLASNVSRFAPDLDLQTRTRKRYSDFHSVSVTFSGTLFLRHIVTTTESLVQTRTQNCHTSKEILICGMNISCLSKSCLTAMGMFAKT